MTGSVTSRADAPYRGLSPRPTGEHVPSLPVLVGGFLGATALVDGTIAAVIGLFVLRAAHGWGPAWVATGMAIGLASGARWRLRVDVDGIVYTRSSAWIIPVRRARYFLDARVELYEAWEDPQPTGVCVEPLVSGEGASGECFGPCSVEKMSELRDRIEVAIEEARKRAPVLPNELRLPSLSASAAALDDLPVRGPSGRIVKVTTRASARVGCHDLPAGTVLAMNARSARGYVDPRRDDEPDHATVPVPFYIRECGLTSRAGAELHFDARARIHAMRHGFDGVVTIDGLPLDGNAPIAWDNDRGRLTRGTLATSVELGRFAISAGSRALLWPLFGSRREAMRAFELAAEVALPELVLWPDEWMLFERGGKLAQIRLRRDVMLGNDVLRGTVMPIPVLSDGRIDRKACRRRGLLLRGNVG